jgi:hypothetical protein
LLRRQYLRGPQLGSLQGRLRGLAAVMVLAVPTGLLPALPGLVVPTFATVPG